MHKYITSFVIGLFAVTTSYSQQMPDYSKLENRYPRVKCNAEYKDELQQIIKKEQWAESVLTKLKDRIDFYADREPEWLSSRLMMHWNSKAKDIYIKGEFYSHKGNEQCDFPTVMFNGARNHSTIYGRPKIEDRIPYCEDVRGVLMHNRSLEGAPLEWAPISKTGTQIAGANQDIMNVARDGAFLWWVTNENKYAEMSYSVFDTYMNGIYNRNIPHDLNKGHQQTLVGMTTFEVIHEAILNPLVILYDFLHTYIEENNPDKIDIYDATFKKWADNIIDNGVPHNNWNLIQAHYIANIAMILKNNNEYSDAKGREYYINKVLFDSSIRQWSLKDLAQYGFDEKNGIWAESPGYSLNVVWDYVSFVNLFDKMFNIDLLEYFPVIEKAVASTPQYLFPNKISVGFGDTHPHKLRTDIFEGLVRNAIKNNKKEQEKKFTSLLKYFNKDFCNSANNHNKSKIDINTFFPETNLTIDMSIPVADIDDYVSPTFWAPNVNWLVQRNGMDKEKSLMFSINGSEGNHMHSNGISMELYGKGYPLAPDAGIGMTLYSGLDYLEYYSQFPSHNTVCVDGISSYPIMKSNHAFDLISCYPSSESKKYLRGVQYNSVSFIEPESQSKQTRLMGIITADNGLGYYIDIFRSRKIRGNDKMHDYFYHNLGQRFQLVDINDNDLDLKPTQELAFAGAHLYAYSYIFDKQSVTTDKDVKGYYTIDMPDGNNITMQMWMKGEKDRELFKALSPMTEGLCRTEGMPYNIKEQPTLTYVARQRGEAWTRPFVAIYEPVTVNDPGIIETVSFPDIITESEGATAILVTHKDKRTDLILSLEDSNSEAITNNMELKGEFAIYSKDKNCETYMLGNGTRLKYKDVKIDGNENMEVILKRYSNKLEIYSNNYSRIRIGNKSTRLQI